MKIKLAVALAVLVLSCGCSTASAFSSYDNYDHAVVFKETDFSIEYQLIPPNGSNPGYRRTINLRVKSQASSAAVPAIDSSPILIYSHGGSEGRLNGHSAVGQPWTDFLVQEGFITINIGHAPVLTVEEHIAICEAVGIDNSPAFNLSYTTAAPDNNLDLDPLGTLLDHNGDCAYFNATQYLRYRDVKTVRNRIQTDIAKNVSTLLDEWNGSTALMGHSAGTGSVMSFAGATRTFLDPSNTYEINNQARFDAYIALSPQSHTVAPHVNGYAINAWDGINQPVLMMSGRLDTTGSQNARDRKIPFDDMPAGDKYWLWFRGNTSGHSEMAMDVGYTAPALDSQYEVAERTVLRFLEIYTLGQLQLTLDDVFVTDNFTYTKADFLTK